jgi:phosphopantothenoylcysteine synthetase/decarboxylase
MSDLSGREIAIGVSGSIAAFRAAELVSSLAKQGARVTVVMSRNAGEFVTPLTFRTLSRNRVIESFHDTEEWRPEHVSIADAAELCLVAPATANIIGKMANGIADDALSTFLISIDCPVLVAPAMNTRMYNHPAMQSNLETLRTRGVSLIAPEKGELACGTHGVGRLAPVAQLEDAIKSTLGVS